MVGRLAINYPSGLKGGLILFGIVMIIGFVQLYYMRKANQSKALRQGIKNEAIQFFGRERRCREAGGQWLGKCCLGAKYYPAVRECSTN